MPVRRIHFDSETNPYVSRRRSLKGDNSGLSPIATSNASCDELVRTTRRLEQVKKWTWSQIEAETPWDPAYDMLDDNPDIAGDLFEAIYGPVRREQ